MVKMGGFNKNKYRFSTMSVVTEKRGEIAELRQNEISILVKELYLYKVLLRDLVGHFPTYKDRNLILNISYYIVEENEIFNKLEKTRELPFGRISRETKISKGFLERWQDYIITYVIIISNPNFTYIQNYIKVEQSKKESSNVINLNEKKETSHRGIVLKVNKKSVMILTSSGEFYKIKKSDNVEVGQEVHGLEKSGFAHYKFYIGLGILLVFLVAGIAYKSYVKASSIVMFNCTSQIKMEINRKNKVVYAYSASTKGKEMINNINPMDKNIDDILKELMKYAEENEMIPEKGFTIMITGEALKYNELQKTDEYVVDNNISVQINNAGSLHNVYENAQINKSKKTN